MAMAYRDGPAAQDNHLEEVAGVGRTAEFEELRDHEELAAQFFAAFKEGDVDGLRELLATDVQLVSDTGGKAPAPRRVVVGAEKTARLLAATAPPARPDRPRRRAARDQPAARRNRP